VSLLRRLEILLVVVAAVGFVFASVTGDGVVSGALWLGATLAGCAIGIGLVSLLRRSP
jgi:hypothetical protein